MLDRYTNPSKWRDWKLQPVSTQPIRRFIQKLVTLQHSTLFTLYLPSSSAWAQLRTSNCKRHLGVVNLSQNPQQNSAKRRVWCHICHCKQVAIASNTRDTLIAIAFDFAAVVVVVVVGSGQFLRHLGFLTFHWSSWLFGCLKTGSF